MHKKITIEEKNKMLEMYEKEKKSIATISKELNRSISAVNKSLKELNYTPRNNREQALKYFF